MLITAIVDNLERAILRFKTKLRLKRIIKQPTAQFEQRSSNWISERKNIFTASEVACFIKKDKKSVLPYFDAFYSDRVNGNSQDFDKFLNDFLQTNKKLDNGIFTGIGVHKFDDPASVLNKKLNEQSKLKEKKLPQPLVWGTQFEKIALNLYQIKNELKDSEIFQTGLVVHEQYKFLGCSIDVLDLKNSYLVEFKCPFKEKKPFLPDLYAWIQTQIQMEIFDLSRAKIVISQFGEYSDVFTFTNDPETQQYSGIFIQESKSTDEVSCVYPPTEYLKPYLSLTEKKELLEWATQYSVNSPNSKILCWYLIKYEEFVVKRSKLWFKHVLPTLTYCFQHFSEKKKEKSYF